MFAHPNQQDPILSCFDRFILSNAIFQPVWDFNALGPPITKSFEKVQNFEITNTSRNNDLTVF